jgi:hypothetical protein
MDYEQHHHTPEEALVASIKTIIDKIDKHNTKNEDQQINILDIKISKLLVGGGVDDGLDLIRAGFFLLNTTTINIEEQLQDPLSKHLCQELKGKIAIIPAITYLLADDEEDKGK